MIMKVYFILSSQRRKDKSSIRGFRFLTSKCRRDILTLRRYLSTVLQSIFFFMYFVDLTIAIRYGCYDKISRKRVISESDSNVRTISDALRTGARDYASGGSTCLIC